jgi:glycosyltransferase involved in cell wall biosynthesis
MQASIPVPGISVIVPTYNRSGVLLRAIRSILNQTVAPGEVIIVDDGSTDDTQDQVGREFPDLQLLCQERQGVSSARNHGIRKAQFQWITFLDSDDQWLPEKLEKQLDAVSGSDRFAACHTNEIWVRNGRRVNPLKKHQKRGGWIFPDCLDRCVISPSSIMIQRQVLTDLGGFDESLPVCEDYDLWLRLTSSHPVAYLDAPLIVKYGGHSDQLSGQYWGMDRFRIRALEKILGQDELRKDYRQLALETLHRKIGIYIQGARKRGRNGIVEEYEKKLTAYRDS